MTRISIRVTRLFAQPSFIVGMAKAFDLGSTLNIYNTTLNENIADCTALNDDWYQVGEDMMTVMEGYEYVK